MVKLRGNRADRGDYDSVLDVMTNVVGILVIVVAVTQLNVSSAVGRARATLIASKEGIDHPPVSDEKLAVARTKQEEAASRLADLRRRSGEEGETEGVGEEEREALRVRLLELGPSISVSRLRAEVRKTRTEIEALEAEITRLQSSIEEHSERIRELKEQIEVMRERRLNRPPPLRMRLPDPDAKRVESLDVMLYVVKNGVVYEWDVGPLGEAWGQNARRDLQDLPARLRSKRAQLKWLASVWNGRRHQNRVLRLEFRVDFNGQVEGGWDIVMEEKLQPDAPGTTLAELQAGRGEFSQRLQRLSSRKHWLYFRVYDDSFESYLVARALAEDAGLAVGWMPYGADQRLQRSVFVRGEGGPLESD